VRIPVGDPHSRRCATRAAARISDRRINDRRINDYRFNDQVAVRTSRNRFAAGVRVHE
jgi:hypothetical protein